MHDVIPYLSFSVWLISLSLMLSKSSHVAANSRISFFRMPVTSVVSDSL